MYEDVLHVDIVYYRGFWLPYKNNRGFWLPYRNYHGFWLPYRNYRGGQLPCKNYCALSWSLVTVQTLPRWPVTVRKLLRITAVAGYRGKLYRDEKSLPREALVFFPFILDIKFVGRTSRGHTGGRSHRIYHPPFFCGACLNFSREKDSAIPFPRRP